MIKGGKEVARFFQCTCDPDNPHIEQEPEPDWERDEFLESHDPNAIDGEDIRKLLGDHLVNLGHRVNDIPCGAVAGRIERGHGEPDPRDWYEWPELRDYSTETEDT